MKGWKWLLAVASLAMFAAWPAHAETFVKGKKVGAMPSQPVGGFSYPDSLVYPFKVNSAGVLSTLDATATTVTTTNLINRIMLASTLADSNVTPVSVLGATRLALVVRITPDSLSAAPVIFLQVRAHTSASSDSNSTASWIRQTSYVTALADTALTYNTNIAQAVLVPQAGEFKVIGTAGAVSPRAVIIPLANNISGDYFPAPYLSVRVRPAGGIKSRYALKVDLVQFNR